jgi:polysaccharide export outer membrane protein
MNSTSLARIVAIALCAAIAIPVAALGQMAPRRPAPSTPAAAPSGAAATAVPADYQIGGGDVLRVTVFQNPDLSQEIRVSEAGTINYPLIGTLQLGGLSVPAAERLIAKSLKDGGFVVAPQVTILLTTVKGNQVTVLGQVARPGKFPLETSETKLSDILADAGGVTSMGDDKITLSGVRDGKKFSREIDVASLFASADGSSDLKLRPGDVIFVNRAAQFYIYGEIGRPGAYRLERDMRVMQAIAAGGGVTQRGTQRGIKIHRKGTDGKVQIIEPKLDDPVLADDVVYIKESIF